jgi:hypothetical protein
VLKADRQYEIASLSKEGRGSVVIYHNAYDYPKIKSESISNYEFGFCPSEPKAKNLISLRKRAPSVPSLRSGLRACPECNEGMTKR